MSGSSAPLANRDAIEDAVQEHGWHLGPWSNEKLDIAAFYVDQSCRETSHPDWALLFTATEGSQKSAIDWNNAKFKAGQSPDAPSFAKMVHRFVLAHAVAKHVLTPAGVGDRLIADFIAGVNGGMHHASLDEMLKVDQQVKSQ